jgi:uncharacterized protein YceH (UPF0502 family)
MKIRLTADEARVQKYQQIFCNTGFGSLKFTPQETGIVCELLPLGSSGE